jgi:hypothetical protein
MIIYFKIKICLAFKVFVGWRTTFRIGDVAEFEKRQPTTNAE